MRDSFWGVFGSQLINPDIPSNPGALLFICKGNICRSAYGHYYCVKMLSTNKNSQHIDVTSAGLFAKDKASPQIAISVAEERGVNMAQHIPAQVDEKTVQNADMVFVVEPKQKEELERKYPECKEKIYLLAFFENNWKQKYSGWHRYHIEDPYGQERVQFAQCFERIERCVDGLLANIDKRS